MLHLIDKNKVDIYDIPIATITDQYMDCIRGMDSSVMDMDVMSEFLVMAATLLDIKSRMLLPKEVNEEGEEQDPRAFCGSASRKHRIPFTGKRSCRMKSRAMFRPSITRS